ncbi:hypothetical protein UCRPA7_6007 [Phaeoacremonium minimum UCRPA7]|uniref:Uncharacterized protein n=1 Tax=Phaeoacremonium minimum (strain UCR-PA7) TaxID=1286976 RepID=R8BGK4_PHAM7|nr:hypothetical protein UCRPA7_6007 [Phaeoacremonium minimum UCRPA7]EON98465.1 hypothetical protein UCRPA7_6007 [Phaeoacremonium minimum UCRPA7]
MGTEMLNRRLAEALREKQTSRRLTELEQEILRLCTESGAVAASLLEAVDKVSVRDQPGSFDAARGVITALWKRKSIMALGSRLASLKGRLTDAILINMQLDMASISQKQSQFWTLSGDDTKTIQEWARAQQKHMEQLQENLVKAVTASHLQLLQSLEESSWEGLPSWDKSPVAHTLTESLLNLLDYGEIRDRESKISRTFEVTLQWIFSKKSGRSNFRDWLVGGNGVYWITGKPGSGKSTLMKMLCQDPQTTELLASWSGSTPVVTAAHYFWNSGTELQTSQEGLLRCLLHQALSARLAVRPSSSLSSKWSAFSLSVISRQSNRLGSNSSIASNALNWDQLIQAFRFLVEEDKESMVNYVFFIDGLDEYVGEPRKLISIVQQLASYPDVKICVSSRPLIVFDDAFKKSPKLMLQDFTKGDIALYANENLSRSVAFRELTRYDPAYASRLIEDITSKASGVFLWVVLVVRSLLEGIAEGDNLTELARRFEELPEELDELFKKMLHGMTGDHFRDAAHLFRLFSKATTRRSVLLLSLADDHDHEWALKQPVRVLTAEELLFRANAMRRRLSSRCKGLLEIGPLGLPPDYVWQGSRKCSAGTTLPSVAACPSLGDARRPPTEDTDANDGYLLAAAEIDYLHRTVKDFLTSPLMGLQIVQGSDKSFTPHAGLFRAHLVHLKAVPIDELRPTLFVDVVSRCLDEVCKLSQYDKELHIRYLDALDDAVQQLATKRNANSMTYIETIWGKGSGDYHWVSTDTRLK